MLSPSRDHRFGTLSIRKYFDCSVLSAFVLVSVFSLFAVADEPPSRRGAEVIDPTALPRIELPPVDVAKLLAEDRLRYGKDIPQRVGFPMKVDFDTENSGTWETLENGDRIWRLRLRSKRALWVVLGFGTFRLQPGGELWVYSEDSREKTALGPFTAKDIRRHGQLWFPPLEGDTMIVEIFWPKTLGKAVPNLHLGTVSHGYQVWGGIGRDARVSDPDSNQRGDAGACNIDVACPLGADWQDQKRGVMNLLSNGSEYCTGSLIATTAQDCQNLVLTAAHCVSSQSKAASTTFEFNYERPACNSGVGPRGDRVTGSVLRATYADSDFTILEMDVEPPESFNVFYNGWNRSTTPASASWGIHHPRNEEKAISRNGDPLIDGQNWGPTHWRVTEWEEGTTEPGSSGSPLFDPNKRIIGQLQGGTASCTSITYDEYGKLAVSWDGGGTSSSRLSDWLDPGGTGVVFQDGVDAASCRVPQPKLLYFDHLVDDSAGNGNGVVDPGETFVLEIDSKNSGTLDATTVQGVLTSTTPAVTINDAQADWPNLAQGSVARSIAPHFNLTLASDHPCGTPLDFTLEMTATEDPGTWTSTFEVPTGVAQVNEAFRDDMESGVNGWTWQALSGNNPWSQVTTDAASPSTSWFVNDIDTVSDSVLLMSEVTALAADSELIFMHRINAETDYDGGVLEYSTDAGVTWIDAGGLITQGAYNSRISTSYSSPIGGRDAWSGDSGGFVEVRVDLSSLAGSNLRLRWRFATDSSTADQGWWIDDVVVQDTTYQCDAPVALPGEASAPSGGGLPFTIAKHVDGYELTWSAPPNGGATEIYKLYRSDLSMAYDPVCEADLGSGTTIVLPSLPGGYGFLPVARNSAGEGSYGFSSDGVERAPAVSACP